MSKKLNIQNGTIWAVEGSDRVPFDNLQSALDYQARCCGLSCCEKLIRLEDQETGDKMTLYFSGGALKIKNEKTGSIYTVGRTQDGGQ